MLSLKELFGGKSRKSRRSRRSHKKLHAGEELEGGKKSRRSRRHKKLHAGEELEGGRSRAYRKSLKKHRSHRIRGGSSVLPEFLCLHCKRDGRGDMHKVKHATKKQLPNTAFLVKGSCADCGGKISRIMSSRDV